MKVTEKDVNTVAVLSRLSFSPEEMTEYAEKFSSIIDYMDILQKADTADVPPTAHALPMQNVLREDVVRPSIDRELALLNAPEKEDGYFKVPKVLEE